MAEKTSDKPYWQDVQVVSVNKEYPRTSFMTYDNRTDALTGKFEKSNYYQLLNGTWKFFFADSYKDLPANITDPSVSADSWNDIKVPGNWEVQGYGVAIYTNHGYEFKPRNPQPPSLNLLTDAIIEFVSHSRSFMPHFHIPLQSGCDEVLQLMRRRYDTALFASKVRKIKEVMPDAFIGVDVIVGTRGETPEYFEQAYQFIDGLDVTQLHVFSYSERPGTQALKIEYVVSPEEKHQRSQRLLTLSDQKTQAFYARHIGQVMPVLMEKSKTGVPMHGFTENYIRVEVENDDSLDNRVVNVRLGDFNEERTALKSTILI